MRSKETEAIGRLQEKVKKIERWLEKSEERKSRRGNIKQSNLTDKESAKMPSGHGLIQGYNGIAAVDAKHQVIVHAEAFGEGQEGQLLRPMLDGMRESFSEIGERDDAFETAVLVADAGYHSEENVRMLIEEEIDAYVPDRKFRKRDLKFRTAGRHKCPTDRKKTRRVPKQFQASEFTYDATKKVLVCPAGKELRLRNRGSVEINGYRGIAYIAKRTDCQSCALRMKCLRKSETPSRQVVIFTGELNGEKSFTQRMIERIDTPRGRYLTAGGLGSSSRCLQTCAMLSA